MGDIRPFDGMLRTEETMGDIRPFDGMLRTEETMGHIRPSDRIIRKISQRHLPVNDHNADLQVTSLMQTHRRTQTHTYIRTHIHTCAKSLGTELNIPSNRVYNDLTIQICTPVRNTRNNKQTNNYTAGQHCVLSGIVFLETVQTRDSRQSPWTYLIKAGSSLCTL